MLITKQMVVLARCEGCHERLEFALDDTTTGEILVLIVKPHECEATQQPLAPDAAKSCECECPNPAYSICANCEGVC